MVDNLRILSSRTDDEQQLLDFLTQPDKDMPSGFVNIKVRLQKYLPGTFKHKPINNNTVIDRYLELTKTRNMLMHYAYKDHEKVTIVI